jgi:hypothetical protein
MAPKRMIDFVRKAERFHRDLSEFYSERSLDEERDDVKLLLEFMSRHESAIEKCLKEYEKDANKNVLETWFKSSPDFSTMPKVAELEFRPDMTWEEVVDLAMKLDEALMGMYEVLIRNTANSGPLQDALQDLLEIERRKEAQFMRNTLLSD